MANQNQNDTRTQGSQSSGGRQDSAGIDPNSAFPGNAAGVTQQATTDPAGATGTGGEQGDGAPMADIIDKAKNKTASELPNATGSKASEEADRTLRAAGHMSTGNLPHGGDDPQHRTNGSMTPMPAETGGKGNVGDTPIKDTGPDR
jgi:hypothetical protein